MSDSDLNEKISSITREKPDAGYRMMSGLFFAKGYILESMARCDPQGVCLRWIRAAHLRRAYSVLGPQALWHKDGHHKLIKWRFIVHAGIDGFSSVPVYLHCSTNNKAATVLRLFNEAVREFGLPARVRSDQGGGNYDVAWAMLSHPQRGIGTMIVGRSVHNQRIERLWRDVYSGVIKFYKELFQHMEGLGMIDRYSELDLFCLQYVFLPRINRALTTFANQWNNHPIRTERHRTPRMLFLTCLQYMIEHDAAIDFGAEMEDEELVAPVALCFRERKI
ncbi:uncharacterized protein [Oscarella lobularis]|uniref:uncharacterized protein n=1 Tax=Oscarella lobularis TaxID=121494 RepID=UPI00331394D8